MKFVRQCFKRFSLLPTEKLALLIQEKVILFNHAPHFEETQRSEGERRKYSSSKFDEGRTVTAFQGKRQRAV